MPADGGAGLGAQQQENAREGIIARASEKLQKFREAIQALFTKEGSDRINKKDTSRIDQILAIAEDDVARVKKEGAPLEMILEEARAGLAEVAFKDDLSQAVEGLKKKQREAVERALKEYREALVEVLKEGENPTMKKEEVVVVPEPVQVSSDKGAMEQEEVAVAVASPERSGEVVARTRDPEEERLVDLAGELTIDGNDPKQAVFLNAAQNADTAWASFEKASGDGREEAKEVYERAVLKLKNAYTEFQKPKSKRAPRAPKSEVATREVWMDQVDEYLVGDLKDDQILLAMLLEYEKPSEHVEEYEKLVSLASDAHQKLKKLKLEEGRIPADQNEKNFNDYKESMKAVKAAAAAYIALGESPATEKTVASGGDFGKDFVARAQSDIAKRQQDRAVEEAAVAQRMAALRESKRGTEQTEVAKLTEVIDQIRSFGLRRAEENIQRLKGSRTPSDVALVDIWEKMKSEGIEIQTARLLQGYLQGRLDKRFVQDDYLPVKQWVEQTIQAGISIFSKESVLEVARIYGFDSEEAILARASVPLPAEKDKSSKGFGSASAEVKRDEGKMVRLKQIENRFVDIDRLLASYKGTPAEKSEGVQKLMEEKKELQREQAQLQAEFGIGASAFGAALKPDVPSIKEKTKEALTPFQESLRDNEDRLKLFKGAIANWKDTTPIDGVIGGWVTWLEAVVEAQKALEKATTPEERTARVENVEAAIVIRPAESEAKKIQEWVKTQRSGGNEKQEYITSVVEPRADTFALVSGFKAQKLTELLQAEKQASVSKVDASDDPVVEMIDDEGDAPSVAPGSPDVTPPASPEAAKVNVEQADLKTQTEAARARLEEIKAIIGSWDTKNNLVHDDKLIKEAVKRLEEIVAHDEAFLANGDKDGSYEDVRKKLTRGGYLARLQERLFEVVNKNKPIYAEQFSAWIKKEEDKPEKERNNAWIEQLQKRQAAVQALKPLFEAFLKPTSQPTPDAKPAPTPNTPPAPDATPAPDASAAPTSADAIPPTPDVKTSAPTPDVAAPVPPAAPPSAPDAIPPAPPTPDKANARPEPGFANEALFSAADRVTILTWLKAQQPRVDRAQKLRADKDLEGARKRYEPFGLNLARLESILNATARLTEAKTDKERMDREAVLMSLREGGVILGAEAALSEIKAERRQLKGDAKHFEDNTPYSGQFQRSKSEIKARLKQIDAEMELMETNVELEQALMETVIVKTTNEDPGKFKNEIVEGEARVEQKDTSWKEVADTASQAHEELRARMETRKRDTEAEPYFGGIFQAVLKEQEATIGLGKALRRFDILDKTELQITQALRLLDNAPSGSITPEQWNALPSAARSVLKGSGESENSTGENIKGRLYEVLRSLTNDKSKANKDLQDQLGLVNGMKEQSAYALAQKTYQKLQADQKQVAQEVRRLTGDIETYNPLKVTKMADKNLYAEKLKEVNGRLELAKNQQRHLEALLKDGEALVGITGQRTLWGQYQKKGGGAIDQVAVFEALKNQQEVTKLIVQVMDGQDRLARLRLAEAPREEEIRKKLSVPSAKGGGASFGKGMPAPKNPTSGGGGEKEKSVWESFKETGLYKGAAQLVEALTFWK